MNFLSSLCSFPESVLWNPKYIKHHSYLYCKFLFLLLSLSILTSFFFYIFYFPQFQFQPFLPFLCFLFLFCMCKNQIEYYTISFVLLRDELLLNQFPWIGKRSSCQSSTFIPPFSVKTGLLHCYKSNPQLRSFVSELRKAYNTKNILL